MTTEHPSAEFLRRFHGPDLWPLTAIDLNRQLETRSFDNERHAVDWIEAKVLARCNVYFNPATPRGRLFKKATKDDMLSTRWLWVDADTIKLTPDQVLAMDNEAIVAHYTRERDEILRAIDAMTPKPTVVVDSGNGFQAFWQLSSRIFNIEQIEGHNRWLGKQLGDWADHTWNIDRVMRLPGTPNIPTETKRRAGITWSSDARIN
jgi:hypothetical protein